MLQLPAGGGSEQAFAVAFDLSGDAVVEQRERRYPAKGFRAQVVLHRLSKRKPTEALYKRAKAVLATLDTDASSSNPR